MLQNEIIERLTSCFTDFRSKLVSRIICVDYIPLTYWHNNMEYYCVIQAEPGEDYSLVFKPHSISDLSVNGVLRSRVCRFNRVSHGLKTAKNILESVADASLSTEQTSRLMSALPINIMTQGYSHLHSYTLVTDTYAQHINNLNNLINELIGIKLEVSEELDYDTNIQMRCIIDRVLGIYDELHEQPDTVEDLLAFVYEIYGVDVDVEAITDISEVSAKNIITTHLSDMQTDGTLDRHMFIANYELLHLFSGRFSRTHRFSIARQRTFQALPEFVPLMMKFYSVPNPLLDVSSGACLFEELKQRYRYLANTELCTNYCSFKGSIVDRSGLSFDYGDPETFNMSRIVYGLASDVNDAYHSTSLMIIPQVDPKIKGNPIVYSTDLAACLVYLTLLDATATLGLKTGKTYLFDKEDLSMYTGFQENDDKLNIEYCTPFSSLYAGDSARGYTKYIDTMLFRAAVNDYVSQPNIQEAINTCEQLKRALIATQDQRRLNRIGVEL